MGILAKLRELAKQAVHFSLAQLGKVSQSSINARRIAGAASGNRASAGNHSATTAGGMALARTSYPWARLSVLAFRGGNKLNHFFGAAKPILNSFRVGPQGSRGQLRRHASLGETRI